LRVTYQGMMMMMRVLLSVCVLLVGHYTTGDDYTGNVYIYIYGHVSYAALSLYTSTQMVSVHSLYHTSIINNSSACNSPYLYTGPKPRFPGAGVHIK
jgi:hypothetical protein